MGKKFKLVTIMLLAILVIAACGKGENNDSNGANKEKLKIMTTFYPMYEFTKNIAGDKADVTLLIPSNQEPHGWEPTPKDIANVQTSDLFVFNSIYMENFVDTIKSAVDNKETVFVEASKGITLKEGLTDEHDHEGEEADHDHESEEAEDGHSHEKDPHVWLSPALAIKEVETITESIIKVDPDNKETYQKNSEKYIAKLTALDQRYSDDLSKVAKKEMITQHAAFGYLASEYGLTQVPISGISPDQEPNAQRLAELKDFAKEHDISVIYFEETASQKVADTLATEIGARTEVLSTLEALSKKDEESGMDYIKVMERNLEKIVQAQQ
ncbi:zinc ABC transporter substrate-binding protein [Niallia circulans]|uniref:metal ABC transporter substrate-binding protein n=1 Tax=Niallia circulans TaxID=1397 RepID=UPI000F455964|nr:metal ABC transporter substrate-binding protein [Niallia circulans]AYV65784.1 zinc ABC transporter substrate-binding protein [Niallia circulans]